MPSMSGEEHKYFNDYVNQPKVSLEPGQQDIVAPTSPTYVVAAGDFQGF